MCLTRESWSRERVPRLGCCGGIWCRACHVEVVIEAMDKAWRSTPIWWRPSVSKAGRSAMSAFLSKGSCLGLESSSNTV